MENKNNFEVASICRGFYLMAERLQLNGCIWVQGKQMLNF
jgi:hypothetical protein